MDRCRPCVFRTLVAILAVLLAASASAAPPRTALTVYSNAEPGAVRPEEYLPPPGSDGTGRPAVPGYAVVKEERDLFLPRGRGEVRFPDVAARIDPTTVSFVSIADPAGTRVLEQNFQFDLVGTDRLLERFLDRPITVESSTADGRPAAPITGDLLSTSGGLVLRSADGGVQVIRSWERLLFPELPGGLITRPTLVWDLQSAKGGEQRVRVSYETGGMTWWADYNFTLHEGKDARSGRLDVAAWVSILNQSGAGYSDATLKLVAGKVHRAEPARPKMGGAYARAMPMAVEAAGFEEKPFFEYHLYTLGRPTTLPDRSTKQVELFPTVRDVPCERTLVYGAPSTSFFPQRDPLLDRDFGLAGGREVIAFLEFGNESAAGLGIPLPAGRVRVSKLDPADGTLEFLGEDTIGHTAKDETVRLRLGTAFDVVGERKQMDFRADTARRQISEEIEVTIRNHKPEAVRVLVRENLLRWSSWEITERSHPFTKLDASTVEFPVEVPKDGETKVRYRVRYDW